MLRFFGHYVPRAFVSLAIFEWLLVVLAILIGAAIRFSEKPLHKLLANEQLWWVAVFYATMLVVGLAATGLYKRGFSEGEAGIIARAGVALLAALVATTLFFYLFPDLELGRGALMFGLVVSFCFLMVSRALFVWFAADDRNLKQVLVLGVGPRARMIEKLCETQAQRHFHVVGFVAVDDGAVAVKNKIFPRDQLQQILQSGAIEEVVIASEIKQSELPLESLLGLRYQGVTVLDLVGFFEREETRLPVDLLSVQRMLLSGSHHNAALSSIGKRALDVTAALLLMLVAWPVMAIVALAIKIDDGLRAPVFYAQERVGLNGKLFNVVKFRSMRVDAERASGPQFAQQNDSRVTRVGKWIRKLRLDELPQIFNVLFGDMSFVGPRPERPKFVKDFKADIPFYDERHRVKPGITGWAQLCYEYGASKEDAKAKLEYDLYYVKNFSLFLDVIIILRTVEVVLWGKGGR